MEGCHKAAVTLSLVEKMAVFDLVAGAGDDGAAGGAPDTPGPQDHDQGGGRGRGRGHLL